MTNAATLRAPSAGVLRRLMRNPLGASSVGVLLLIVGVAAFVPLLPLSDPNSGQLTSSLLPPSAEHLLGTDSTGRDILSRLLWGTRTNLLGAALTVSVAFLIGVPAGIVAGYYGGWLDSLGSWFSNLFMALPGVVVLLAVRAVFGPSLWLSMGVFGVMLAPSYFRLVRSAVQTVRGELFIDAAIVSGVSDLRILGRHVVAVIRGALIIQAARLSVIAITIQAGLEFIGINDPTVPSWGGMLNDAFRRMNEAGLLVVWPSIAIGLTSVALVILANAVRDALAERGPSARKVRPGGRATPAMPSAGPTEVDAEPLTSRPSQSGSTVVAPEATGVEPLLDVCGLRVSYPGEDGRTEVVRGTTFSIGEGEVLGLVGESGSGKSQTAFSILGLLPSAGTITSGSIRFDGRDITALGERRMRALRGREIAYVPQEPMSNLDPGFRIEQQLTVPMRKLLGLSKAAAKERALTLLDQVGIVDPAKVMGSYPFEISGGMAQRVLIAGAVSCHPRLLIADEPTTALDVTVQAEVLEVFRRLQRETGMAILMVTHNIGVVSDICDRVAVMHSGQIVEEGDVRSVLRTPTHSYTRELLDAMLSGDGYRHGGPSTKVTAHAATIGGGA